MRVNNDGGTYTYPLSYVSFVHPITGDISSYASSAAVGCYNVTLTTFQYKKTDFKNGHWDELSCVVAIGV